MQLPANIYGLPSPTPPYRRVPHPISPCSRLWFIPHQGVQCSPSSTYLRCPLASIATKSTTLHLYRFDAPLSPSRPDPRPFAGFDSSSMASMPPSSSPPDPPPFTVADLVPPYLHRSQIPNPFDGINSSFLASVPPTSIPARSTAPNRRNF